MIPRLSLPRLLSCTCFSDRLSPLLSSHSRHTPHVYPPPSRLDVRMTVFFLQNTLYCAQLRALRPLLPQHMGVRPSLALRRPPTIVPSALAGAVAWVAAVRSDAVRGRVQSAIASAQSRSMLDSSDADIRELWISAWRIGQAWRRWSLGPIGAGPYAASVRALHLIAMGRTPMEKAEAALRALSLLANEASAVAEQAGRMAMVSTVGLGDTETGAVGTGARGDEAPMPAGAELTADDLLPLLVFCLARARVPCLPAHVRCALVKLSCHSSSIFVDGSTMQARLIVCLLHDIPSCTQELDLNSLVELIYLLSTAIATPFRCKRSATL